jgi:uncharacterized membrane protein YphA (DoxX/SURF4 family)
MTKMFQNTLLPTAVVVPFGYALPWLEAALGILIIIGFRTREALVCGALLMLALTFGTALRQDWGVAGIQLLYSVVFVDNPRLIQETALRNSTLQGAYMILAARALGWTAVRCQALITQNSMRSSLQLANVSPASRSSSLKDT